MAIENSVSNDFLSTFIDSINIFDCRLSGVYFVFACEVLLLRDLVNILAYQCLRWTCM